MLLLSGAVHAAAFAAFVLFGGPGRAPLSVAPVAVVDLIGGPAGPPPASPAPRPGRPAPAAPAKPRGKAEQRRGRPPAASPRAAKAPAAVPAKPALPETAALAERIRRLREEREAAERVGEAVERVRREKELRQAVTRVGERVARRVDLTSARPAPSRSATPRPSAGLPGGNGPARLPPEYLAYFRALDEKVRANWTVPPLPAGERRALVVQIRVAIEPDGRVSEIVVEKGSGNLYFDDSVLRAIRKASPLPVPPERLRGGESRYEVGFRFYGGGEDA